MNRVFELQEKMISAIKEHEAKLSERDETSEWEIIHMVSSAKIAQLLAIKRGVDPEMAALACTVHDFGRIVTGKQKGHAPAGYAPVKDFLKTVGIFSDDEIETMAIATQNHSSKDVVGTPVEEIVKDADVLDCHQYGLELHRQEQKDRLQKILEEIK